MLPFLDILSQQQQQQQQPPNTGVISQEEQIKTTDAWYLVACPASLSGYSVACPAGLSGYSVACPASLSGDSVALHCTVFHVTESTSLFFESSNSLCLAGSRR